MPPSAPEQALLRPLHPGPLGQHFKLSDQGQTLGRDAEQCQILLAGQAISRRHAWIGRNRQQAWEIRDLDSRNGLFINGRRVEQAHTLDSGDVIGLGRSGLADYQFLLASDPARRRIELSGRGPWSIGRDLSCDLALPADLTVSQRHAVLVSDDEGILIRDSGSRNGLWRNGRRLPLSLLRPGDEVILGHHRLTLLALDPEPVIEFETLDRPIALDRPDLLLEAGRLHLIRLESQAARRALMNQLGDCGPVMQAGFSEHWLEQQPERQLDRIGLVDRTSPLPDGQALEQWLRDELRLRLAERLPPEDEQALTSTTLAALNLDEFGDRAIGQLSAAERERARLSSALLTRPGLLIINDSLAGLDEQAASALVASLDGLCGRELTIVLLTSDRGLPLEVVQSSPHAAPKQPGRATRSSLGTLLKRQLARPLKLLLELLALPLLVMLGLNLLSDLRSGVTATLATLLICAPLAAFSLDRLAIPSDPRLIRRFGLAGAAWLARLLAACASLLVQFLAALILSIIVLPPDVWTAELALHTLLAGAAGLGLGLVSQQFGREGLAIGRLAMGGLLGGLQAGLVLIAQPGLLTLAALASGWMVLDASLTRFNQSRRKH